MRKVADILGWIIYVLLAALIITALVKLILVIVSL